MNSDLLNAETTTSLPTIPSVKWKILSAPSSATAASSPAVRWANSAPTLRTRATATCLRPGFKKDEIHIDLDGDTMTISAERHSEHEEKDKSGNYMRCERSYGSYQRSFDISAVNADAMTAEYTDGVLKLTMPKKEMTVSSAKRLEIR